MLQAIRAKAKKQMADIAGSFFDAIADEGLTVDDFSGKSRGVCSIFIKLQRGEMDEGARFCVEAAEEGVVFDSLIRLQIGANVHGCGRTQCGHGGSAMPDARQD